MQCCVVWWRANCRSWARWCCCFGGWFLRVLRDAKLYAPAGIEVLYGKLELLKRCHAAWWWQNGRRVSFSGTTFYWTAGEIWSWHARRVAEYRIKYSDRVVTSVWTAWRGNSHPPATTENAKALNQLDDIRFLAVAYGPSVITFVMDGVHHQDIATLLRSTRHRVRAGHHCAHPLMDALQCQGTADLGPRYYNNLDDVEKLVAAIEKAVDML